MLPYDPIPWLLEQEGLSAVRARRLLDIGLEGDVDEVGAIEKELSRDQARDGSFEQSLLKTAGVLNLLNDLRATASDRLIEGGASYLISVLEAQPGYERARGVKPGSLQTPCDLCDFFGPYEDRNLQAVMADGAREMNFYREFEPLAGPNKPVRAERRSSLDRAGPTSCYSWGLIPLSYIVETLCRAGYAPDERVHPAVNVLLGVQRESGGWCRNLGGHPNCTIHGLRWLGAHPQHRKSKYAERALGLVRRSSLGPNSFATFQAVAAFDLPLARDILRDALGGIAPRQKKNGTFGTPHRVEKVAAVLAVVKALKGKH